MEKFITEKVLLALLGKGMVYDIEDMDMEYDVKVPMDIFSMEDEPEPRDIDIRVKMNIGSLKFEILKG